MDCLRIEFLELKIKKAGDNPAFFNYSGFTKQ